MTDNPEDQAGPDMAELGEMMQQLIHQNKELVEKLNEETAARQELQNKLDSRSRDGSLAGGYRHSDGMVHYNAPRLSEDREYAEMESEAGLLG